MLSNQTCGRDPSTKPPHQTRRQRNQSTLPTSIAPAGRPLAIDLFCGLGGWTEGLLAEGYHVIGFDIEAHEYGDHKYPGQLVVQDILTLHGSQFKDAALIVASPPCQEYSYMAMPWKRAKAKAAAIRADETGQKLADLNRLFDACFRIQKEASIAAGRHIPMVVENVRGAIPWVGRSRWNFGSFHLWGDVPALMPPAMRFMKVGDAGWRERGPGRTFQDRAYAAVTGAGRKNPGIELGDIGFNVASAQKFGHMVEGVKIKRSAKDIRDHIGAKRKFASAMIAKIPTPLARHIGATYRPQQQNTFGGPDQRTRTKDHVHRRHGLPDARPCHSGLQTSDRERAQRDA